MLPSLVVTLILFIVLKLLKTVGVNIPLVLFVRLVTCGKFADAELPKSIATKIQPLAST